MTQLRLREGEPLFGPWQVTTPAGLLDVLRSRAAARPDGAADAATSRRGPFVVSVDGRSAGGKTTLSRRLSEAVPAGTAAVLHTDDLAWWEPMFGWEHLLREVLGAVRTGDAVTFRPPAWEQRGREGAIELPAGLELLVVEGVGSSQAAVVDLVDAAVWVQSDYEEAQRRGIARDVADGTNGDLEQSTAFWHEWDAHEIRFLAADRPWERADAVVLGTPPAGTLPEGSDGVAWTDARVDAD